MLIHMFNIHVYMSKTKILYIKFFFLFSGFLIGGCLCVFFGGWVGWGLKGVLPTKPHSALPMHMNNHV